VTAKGLAVLAGHVSAYPPRISEYSYAGDITRALEWTNILLAGGKKVAIMGPSGVVPSAANMQRKGREMHGRTAWSCSRAPIREGLKKRLVLIVDGDPARKFLTSIVLQRLDYHVATRTAPRMRS